MNNKKNGSVGTEPGPQGGEKDKLTISLTAYDKDTSSDTNCKSKLEVARDGIEEELNKEVQKNSKINAGLLLVKSSNEWIEAAMMRRPPEKLFYEFWFTDEMCILYADTNLGKSILATQIANEISKIRKVLYLDFELSDKQFEARYSRNFEDHYKFSPEFLRAEIDPDADFEGFDTFEDYLIYSLEQTLISTGAKILIIDNITYLKNETDKAKYALPLMKQLKALKAKHALSILVLAHTPKRDLSKPITQNDLQGSKMLINFCDSAFAIGASQKDATVRYLKQIKQRNCEQKYGTDNVMVFQISKPDNYLFMSFIGFSPEREHLKQITEKDRESIKVGVKELHSKGLSIREIAKQVSISVGSVHNYLHEGI